MLAFSFLLILSVGVIVRGAGNEARYARTVCRGYWDVLHAVVSTMRLAENIVVPDATVHKQLNFTFADALHVGVSQGGFLAIVARPRSSHIDECSSIRHQSDAWACVISRISFEGWHRDIGRPSQQSPYARLVKRRTLADVLDFQVNRDWGAFHYLSTQVAATSQSNPRSIFEHQSIMSCFGSQPGRFGGYLTGVSLPSRQSRVNDDEYQSGYLNPKAKLIAGLMFFVGGITLLCKVWWNCSFNLASHLNTASHIALVMLCACLIWLGMWLTGTGFWAFTGH